MEVKKVYIKTFGCQMNTRDSELVTGLLLKSGYTLADSAEEADIILFNTCSVRKKAEDKVWSEIGKLKQQKAAGHKVTKTQGHKSKSYPLNANRYGLKPIIGLIGCMAQAWQQAAFDKAPLVDLVVGPNNISSLPGLLKDIEQGLGKAIAVGKEQRDAVVYNTEYISEKSHCNVNIMEGCNNFCTYCIVPYVRGRERSRPAEDIINEIKALIKKGVKEITLLGQNVNSYISEGRGTKDEGRKKQKVSFVDLLDMVNDIKYLEKFDFVTSHPKDAHESLFKKMAELEKCRKFLHLPVQSGSDRILKKMNRGYTRAHYIKLAKTAKELIPGLRITTDVMVGFPTETDKDFEDTFSLMKEIGYDAAYIFKYSPRPYTQAADLEDDVPDEVKKERNQILLKYQKQLHRKKHKS
jgi:tRNA-2-methylthio-N6-dimethylallyladenosine synthase